jgi:hypothetical protein
VNELAQLLLRAIGGIGQVKTLGEGNHVELLAAGLWEIRPFQGWTYVRQGDTIIVLDASDLPIACTDAVIVQPPQSMYLNVEKSGEWAFLVEEGGVCQLVLRSLE